MEKIPVRIPLQRWRTTTSLLGKIGPDAREWRIRSSVMFNRLGFLGFMIGLSCHGCLWAHAASTAPALPRVFVAHPPRVLNIMVKAQQDGSLRDRSHPKRTRPVYQGLAEVLEQIWPSSGGKGLTFMRQAFEYYETQKKFIAPMIKEVMIPPFVVVGWAVPSANAPRNRVAPVLQIFKEQKDRTLAPVVETFELLDHPEWGEMEFESLILLPSGHESTIDVLVVLSQGMEIKTSVALVYTFQPKTRTLTRGWSKTMSGKGAWAKYDHGILKMGRFNNLDPNDPGITEEMRYDSKVHAFK